MAYDARRALLTELIDDAGLFPPASLPMEEAVSQHVASRTGPHADLLGRFICPALRLPELAEHLDPLPAWRLSVLIDGADPEPGLEVVAGFDDPRVTIELVESKPAGSIPALLDAFEEAGLGGAMPFLEVAPRDEAALDGVAETMAGAKIRCGGEAEAPSPADVASFIDGCRRRGLRFKATAGLHHPFRHERDGGMQHGFVNLVAASVLAREQNLDAAAIEPIVAELEPGRFDLTTDRLRWRDLEAGPGAIEDARRSLLFSYGSCSFDEPVEDLLALGILPL